VSTVTRKDSPLAPERPDVSSIEERIRRLSDNFDLTQRRARKAELGELVVHSVYEPTSEPPERWRQLRTRR
jgi:hypothetical protein